MQLSSKNPWMRLAAFIVAVVVFGLAWYLISPLFVDQRVSESFPTLAYMPTKTANGLRTQQAQETAQAALQATQTAVILGFSPAEATAQMAEALAADSRRMDDEMPAGENARAEILLEGSFYDVAHHGEGSATVYELEDGSLMLRFENFEVLNGPDLHVYLARQNSIANTVGEELPGSLDLGELSGNVGDQNYFLPEDIDLSIYQSVVIWCEPFRVPFSAASLSAP